MSAVSLARGKAKWAEAESLEVLAAAYRTAIEAAREIGQIKIMEQWEIEWRETETAKVRCYAEARALGFYIPVAPVTQA